MACRWLNVRGILVGRKNPRDFIVVAQETTHFALHGMDLLVVRIPMLGAVDGGLQYIDE